LKKSFYTIVETEGISDVEDLNRILDRAVNLKALLKADNRVDRVAQFVARHFRENVEPLGYKAFLVAVDREACALYKQAPPTVGKLTETKRARSESVQTAAMKVFKLTNSCWRAVPLFVRVV
jgi:hypothetical protein